MDEGPLENRKLNINVNGIGRLLPALHAEWMMTKEWVTYSPPPDPDTDFYSSRIRIRGKKCRILIPEIKPTRAVRFISATLRTAITFSPIGL